MRHDEFIWRQHLREQKLQSKVQVKPYRWTKKTSPMIKLQHVSVVLISLLVITLQ